MTDNHRTTGKQKSQSQRVAILSDGENVQLNPKQGELLVAFALSKGCLDFQRHYYNPQHKNQVSAKNQLENLGFQGVPVRNSGKNSVDKQFVFDCIKRVATKLSPDIIILVSGDRDFAGLILVLMALGKTVIVFARRESASKKLIKLVGDDNFHYVDELPSLCAGLKPQLKKPKELSIQADQLSG
ncbi:hypothetical protein C7B69_05435 [filamentous cyanobacterium Phorm 46]|nr:hypothetical protein C7B69_05435 [filamentous cyanobacterium Phorm 46]PSB52971.1 hypothetical protein C7B67_05120 [filamentous cyanobacterium Phorm 6]